MGITTCPEVNCPFRANNGWCGVTGCIRRHPTTNIAANQVVLIPDDYVRVVLCKDCQYCRLLNDGTSFECTNHEVDYYAPHYDAATYYCADGKRRTDDE